MAATAAKPTHGLCQHSSKLVPGRASGALRAPSSCERAGGTHLHQPVQPAAPKRAAPSQLCLCPPRSAEVEEKARVAPCSHSRTDRCAAHPAAAVQRTSPDGAVRWQLSLASRLAAGQVAPPPLDLTWKRFWLTNFIRQMLTKKNEDFITGVISVDLGLEIRSDRISRLRLRASKTDGGGGSRCCRCPGGAARAQKPEEGACPRPSPASLVLQARACFRLEPSIPQDLACQPTNENPETQGLQRHPPAAAAGLAHTRRNPAAPQMNHPDTGCWAFRQYT